MTASVSLLPAHSYEQSSLKKSLELVLEPFGGMATFVTPGDRVLLKPNLLTGGRPQNECTTRPELVARVAEMVIAAGGHPFIGDSPAFGSARGVAEANGYEPLLTALNIPIVELHGGRYPTESQRFEHLRLSKEAMEADVVINLPKVKSHVQLTMTLGVKNLFGCVPGKMKAWWHMEAGQDVNGFGEMLVETARTLAPSLTILDGIIAHEGNGPSNGSPRSLGILAASNDVFALDRAILEMLRVELEDVPTMAVALRLGYCPDWEDIQFPLRHPREMQVNDWRLPDNLMPIDFGAPRVLRSTFKHLYIRWIKEPMAAYAQR